jgi:hypothetical protein
MTSPDPKSPNKDAAGEGGGMLPALLAGAGILLVAGLFIFGGDDETATEAKDQKTANANAHSAGGAKSGVAARQADDANKTANKPRLNPRIANAVVTEGMAPSPNKKPEPTSFESSADEIVYWEEQLRSAESMLEIRQRAADYAPSAEDKIREKGSPEDLAEFQKRLVVVSDNLEKAQARVAEVEAKLKTLRGG